MVALFEIVLPVFALVAVGYGVALTPVIKAEGMRGIAEFVYWVAIPALLFRTMASTAPPAQDDLATLAAYFLSCFLVYGACLPLLRVLFDVRLAEGAVLGMGATFGNSVMLGIPLVQRSLGAEGLATLLLIISVHAALLFTLATITVELGRGRGDEVKPGAALRAAGIAAAKNPMILAIFAGLAFSVAGLKLPAAIDRAAELLSAAGIPCALFALGASLISIRPGKDLAAPLTVTAIKLLALPAIVYAAGRWVFDLQPLALAVSVICAALPAGNNAFIFAQRHQVGVERSATVVLVSTALSVVSLTALLGWLT
ncbi:MAG: AEC family transporter [Elsteraceae bacterium]